VRGRSAADRITSTRLRVSPHVDRSRARRLGSHAQALIDILEPTQQTLDALMKLDLPAGVDVEIKAFEK